MKKYVRVLVGSSESVEQAEKNIKFMEKTHGFRRDPGSVAKLFSAFVGEKAWLVSGQMPEEVEGDEPKPPDEVPLT
jgi:hypothetical protein